MRAVVLACLLSGCVGSFEEARLVSKARPMTAASTDAQRIVCRGIDRERSWFGAGAALAGACTAGTGVPALIDVVDDKDAKTALQVTMVVCGVSAAGLVILRDSAGTRWVGEGCGQ